MQSDMSALARIVTLWIIHTHCNTVCIHTHANCSHTTVFTHRVIQPLRQILPRCLLVCLALGAFCTFPVAEWERALKPSHWFIPVDKGGFELIIYQNCFGIANCVFTFIRLHCWKQDKSLITLKAGRFPACASLIVCSLFNSPLPL